MQTYGFKGKEFKGKGFEKDSNGKRKELTENAENERITGRQVKQLKAGRAYVLALFWHNTGTFCLLNGRGRFFFNALY